MPEQEILETPNNMLQVYQESKENCKKNEETIQLRYWQGMQLFPQGQKGQREQNLHMNRTRRRGAVSRAAAACLQVYAFTAL